MLFLLVKIFYVRNNGISSSFLQSISLGPGEVSATTTVVTTVVKAAPAQTVIQKGSAYSFAFIIYYYFFYELDVVSDKSSSSYQFTNFDLALALGLSLPLLLCICGLISWGICCNRWKFFRYSALIL